jgi:predicted metal-dependent enzyme (double-stranded beta helix superfamily)
MKTRHYVSVLRAVDELAVAVRAAVSARGDWEHTAHRVAAELRPRLPGPEILTSGQRYGDPLGYQCHLLHAEPDGSFSVVALVLRPGQETPVHDHVTWCVSGVLQGAENEERFELTDDGWLAGDGADAAGRHPPGQQPRPGDDTLAAHLRD